MRIVDGNVLGNETPGTMLDGPQRVPCSASLTNLAWELGLLVNDALHPAHQVLNVGRGRHLGRTLEILGILPQVLEPTLSASQSTVSGGTTYSSVAFISGHDCGEQNSVIDP